MESADPSISKALEERVYEFINSRKWTGDQFKSQERIQWSILIELQTFDGANTFTGSIQVQSRRPVYGSSYNSTIWSFKDANVAFIFDKNSVLEYSENTFLSNLTALLAYYSYMVLAYDYESFSENGGGPYLTKAQEIAQMSQSSGYEGWASNEKRNRYWLVENHLNPRFAGLRKCMYEYHRLGLDQMSTDVKGGRDAIAKSLEYLKTVHTNVPNSFNIRVFFDSKASELINIFKEADRDQKTKVIDILNTVDPANIIKYQEILN
ncbi:MAG: DUF4835 family protein [Flavobacteriales bacterium]|nr:DUF4835 family protein [Flavobacteriales bacterium]